MTDETRDEHAPNRAKARRNTKGHWLPGASANPRGRPTKPWGGTWTARHLLNEALPELTQKAIALAQSGDFAALKLCLERCIPIPRDEPLAFPMAPINSLNDIDKALGEIVNFVASGDLTPSEANGVAQLLEQKRRALELTLVDARLDALEAFRSNGHDVNGYDTNGHAP
jgi:hypothetical protein